MFITMFIVLIVSCDNLAHVSPERRGTRTGRVPPGAPTEPGGVLGGGDRAPFQPHPAGHGLHARGRAHSCFPASGGRAAAEAGHCLLPWGGLGAGQRT